MDHNADLASSSRAVDARIARTRETLLAAMLRLLDRQSFDQTTIRDIAAEASIGYATFFRHYPDKEALLHDLAAGEIATLLEQALPVLFAVDSRQSCVALFETVAAHRALWTALLTGGAASTLKEEFTAQAKRIADSHGAVGGWLPDELRVVYAVSATVEILSWWLQQGTAYPVEQMAAILDRLVVMPVMAPE